MKTPKFDVSNKIDLVSGPVRECATDLSQNPHKHYIFKASNARDFFIQRKEQSAKYTALYILENYPTPAKIANMNVRSFDALRRVSYGRIRQCILQSFGQDFFVFICYLIWESHLSIRFLCTISEKFETPVHNY